MNLFPAAPAPPPGRAATLDFRVLRALPFAAVCVAVSAFGHALAGGGTVSAGALLLGGLVVWALAAALAGRERGLAGIATGLAVGQLGLHLLFHTVAMPGMPAPHTMASMPAMASMPDMPGMPAMDAGGTGGMAGMTDMGMSTGGPPSVHPSLWTHAFLGLTPLMLLGHLLAALVAGWWLRRGEAALWQVLRIGAQATETRARTWAAPLRALLDGALAVVRGLLGALGTTGGARFRTLGDDRPLPRTAQLRHQVVRRGPPAALTA